MKMDFPIPPDENRDFTSGCDAEQRFPDTFEIYVDDDRYAVPTLHLVTADDPAKACAAAQRLIDESPHHLGAEVCLEGQRVAGLGSFAVRSLPPEADFRKPE